MNKLIILGSLLVTHASAHRANAEEGSSASSYLSTTSSDSQDAGADEKRRQQPISTKDPSASPEEDDDDLEDDDDGGHSGDGEGEEGEADKEREEALAESGALQNARGSTAASKMRQLPPELKLKLVPKKLIEGHNTNQQMTIRDELTGTSSRESSVTLKLPIMNGANAYKFHYPQLKQDSLLPHGGFVYEHLTEGVKAILGVESDDCNPDLTFRLSSTVEYVERDLVADEGNELKAWHATSLDHCKVLCNDNPECLSFAFSEISKRCCLKDKAVSHNDDSKEAVDVPDGYRTYYSYYKASKMKLSDYQTSACNDETAKVTWFTDVESFCYQPKCESIPGHEGKEDGCFVYRMAAPEGCHDHREGLCADLDSGMVYVKIYALQPQGEKPVPEMTDLPDAVKLRFVLKDISEFQDLFSKNRADPLLKEEWGDVSIHMNIMNGADRYMFVPPSVDARLPHGGFMYSKNNKLTAVLAVEADTCNPDLTFALKKTITKAEATTYPTAKEACDGINRVSATLFKNVDDFCYQPKCKDHFESGEHGCFIYFMKDGGDVKIYAPLGKLPDPLPLNLVQQKEATDYNDGVSAAGSATNLWKTLASDVVDQYKFVYPKTPGVPHGGFVFMDNEKAVEFWKVETKSPDDETPELIRRRVVFELKHPSEKVAEEAMEACKGTMVPATLFQDVHLFCFLPDCSKYDVEGGVDGCFIYHMIDSSVKVYALKPPEPEKPVSAEEMAEEYAHD